MDSSASTAHLSTASDSNTLPGHGARLIFNHFLSQCMNTNDAVFIRNDYIARDHRNFSASTGMFTANGM